MYLRDDLVPLLGDNAPPRVQQLAARVTHNVACDRSPSALFAGLEAHVRQQLANDAFPRFVASAHYQRLCDALRDRRELPLGEVLVSRERTRFLERHLRAREPNAVGNLCFWVDVQTVFLPLLQTPTVVSVALFEQIQAAVRRIYNTYLTGDAATLLSDELRRDTLKCIMVLQGEPFSPPRYAGLFRRAQEKVWEWLQADVYPSFRQSPLYVRLVVEIENLESDRQLRRLSEQVRARSGGLSAKQTRRGDAKTSAVVVPVVSGLLGPPTARTLAWLRAHVKRVDASAFQREIVGLEADDDAADCAYWRQRTRAFFHSVRESGTATDLTLPTGATGVRVGARYDLVCRSGKATSTTHLVRPVSNGSDGWMGLRLMDDVVGACFWSQTYCWSQLTMQALPAVLSPSHRTQQLGQWQSLSLSQYRSLVVAHCLPSLCVVCMRLSLLVVVGDLRWQHQHPSPRCTSSSFPACAKLTAQQKRRTSGATACASPDGMHWPRNRSRSRSRSRSSRSNQARLSQPRPTAAALCSTLQVSVRCCLSPASSV